MVVSCPLCLWVWEQSPQACVSFCLAATFAVDGSWEVPWPDRAGNARGPLAPGEATWLFLRPARVQAQLWRWLQYASLDPAAPGSFSAMEADVTIATTMKAGIASSMALPTPLHHKKYSKTFHISEPKASWLGTQGKGEFLAQNFSLPEMINIGSTYFRGPLQQLKNSLIWYFSKIRFHYSLVTQLCTSGSGNMCNIIDYLFSFNF